METNNEIIEELKKTTIEEILNILINNLNTKQVDNNNTQKNILSINEIVKEYPMFSRYSLEKAINEKDLPFIKLGNKKFFERETIEKWLNANNTTAGKKRKFDL